MFEIPLIDTDNELMNIEKFDYAFLMHCNTELIQEIVEQLKLFSDIINLDIQDNMIKFTSSCETKGENKIELEKSNCLSFQLKKMILIVIIT